MKKTFLFMLLCTLCIACALSPAKAETVTLDGIVYEIKDGYASFASFVEGVTSVTVHDMVSGYPTDYNTDNWEEDTTIREILIGSDIPVFGGDTHSYSLLHRCAGVERIVIPATVTGMGGGLQYTGRKVKEFVVAEDNPSFKSIGGVLYSKNGRSLIYYPKGLAGEYTTPPEVMAISPWAFGDNMNLTALAIPEGVIRLEEGTLRGMQALLRLSLPASLQWVEQGALPYSGALIQIDVAEGNEKFAGVDGVLFSKDQKTLLAFPCARGGSYIIPEGTTAISENAFSWNDQLTSLILPEGITSLPDGALAGLSSLTELHLPASLQSMGGWTLPYGGNLVTITVPQENAHYLSQDGVLFSRDGQTLLYYPPGREGFYQIPAGTRSIAPRAFTSSEAITGVSVPEGITSLPEYTFSGNPNLLTVRLPASLEEMGEGALPGYGVLERVEVSESNPRYKSINGVLFDRENLIFFPPHHSTSYDVPAGTKSIGARAFSDRENLQTVTIPRSVTAIGESAFAGCTSLERIILPITLTSIEEYTFYRCTSLTEITLPPGLCAIGSGAFYNCISLTGIALPPSLSTIGAHAFYNCPQIKDITIPDSVTAINQNAFSQHAESFFLRGARGSAAYWHAWEYGLSWAAPGEAPGMVKPVDRQTQSAIVNNPDISGRLPLYAKNSKSAKTLGKYENGTTVQVLESSGGWAKVRLYDKEGYMPTDTLVFTDKFNSLVQLTWGRKNPEIKQPLRLYEAAFDQSPWQEIQEDVAMRILDTEGIWFRVQLHDKEGYVPVQSLWVAFSVEPISQDGFYYGYSIVSNPSPHDRLHLRAEPSTKSKSLGRYFNGTQVQLLDYGDPYSGWLHVRVDGQEGYMMAQYLQGIYWGGQENLWGHG